MLIILLSPNKKSKSDLPVVMEYTECLKSHEFLKAKFWTNERLFQVFCFVKQFFKSFASLNSVLKCCLHFVKTEK